MALNTKTGAYFVYKQKLPFEDKDRDSLLRKRDQSRQEFNYFLFHSRAPTNSTETKWSAKTTHPFQYEDCHVAHNGIITNFSSFEESKHCEIDSQIIPEHLVKTQSIVETFSRYEGLYTCWIVRGDKLQVVKAGSSLWMSDDSFSSSKFDMARSIDENGVIFDFKDGKFEKSDTFAYTNIYFL